MVNAPDSPAATATAGAAPTTREATLAAAEQFLLRTAEAIHPGLSASTLLRYVERYRDHLATVVAASREADGVR